MNNVKILDCTLRDGGYINNWKFGFNNIKTIINSLYDAGIDFVEFGFMSNHKFDKDYVLFNTVSDITNYSDKKKHCVIMLNYGEVSIDNIEIPPNFDVEIRLAFKKHQLNDLPNYLRIFKKRGIKYSLNPMHTSIYTSDELEILFDLIDRHNPVCVTVVDTMGIMDEIDTEKIFKIFDKRIRKNIPLGFHSHNNLDKSISNIRTLFELNINRELIIDSSLKGIGRGGGMPSTFDLINLIDSNKYDLEQVKYLEETIITPIINCANFIDKKPFYLSAMNKCHPNYALYLIKNIGQQYLLIDKLLSKIPNENKIIYSEQVIRNILNLERGFVK